MLTSTKNPQIKLAAASEKLLIALIFHSNFLYSPPRSNSSKLSYKIAESAPDIKLDQNPSTNSATRNP